MQISPLFPGERSPSDRRWPRRTEHISKQRPVWAFTAVFPLTPSCVCVYICVFLLMWGVDYCDSTPPGKLSQAGKTIRNWDDRGSWTTHRTWNATNRVLLLRLLPPAAPSVKALAKPTCKWFARGLSFADGGGNCAGSDYRGRRLKGNRGIWPGTVMYWTERSSKVPHSTTQT